MMQYKIISDSSSVLGEGISLRPSKDEVSWVDITGNKVFWKNLETGEGGSLLDFELPSCTFSDENSGVFISHVGGIDWVDQNYQNRQVCATWFPKDSGLRCNDGKMDSKGNIWISTMDVSHSENKGSIWMWDRKSKPVLVVDNLTIPNSIVVDDLRNRIYFADSVKKTIYCGELSDRRNSINSLREFYFSENGVPDGSTLDSDGNLWNARWDASSILKLNWGGEVTAELKTPFLRPTSCVLSHDKSDLFVTSASIEGDFVGGQTIRLNSAQ